MSRYIDADKLKVDIKEIAGKQDGKLTEFEVLGIMSAQPTADVRENVNGEWEDMNTTSGYKRCSVCSHIFNDIVLYKANGRTTVITQDIPFQFCPNCGADMRGEA